jgi:hypothetical protein
LAAFQRGGPAIDGCLYGMVLSADDKNCGEKRQHAACNDSLDDLCDDAPMLVSKKMKPYDARDDSHGQGDTDPSDPLSHICHVSITAHFLPRGTLEESCFLI